MAKKGGSYKTKFSLINGAATKGTGKYSLGYVAISLAPLEKDTVTCSPVGISIGSHAFRFSDFIAFELLVFQSEGGFWTASPVNSIRIALNDGQEFVLLPVQGTLDTIGKLNKQMLELFTQLNTSWQPVKQALFPPLIKRTVLDLGTKFTRLQIIEIAESCKITDESLIIATIQDMIAKHQIDAQYFASTRSVAFNQQANLAARETFIAELEKEFAAWGTHKGGKV